MAKNDPAAATESKNPQNMVKIPVIIADRQLQPFHTFELGGNVYPLTSERIEAALLNPAVFEGPALQPHRQKSLIDQMYPPYQQRQGFGRTVGAGTSSMGVTKVSSAEHIPPAAIAAGLLGGFYSGKAVAGHTAAAVAPRGKKTRSDDIARRAAIVGGPVGGIAALIAAKKLKLTDKALMKHLDSLPSGLLTDPATERKVLQYAVPALAGGLGTVGGGALTGLGVGAAARMRTKEKKEKRASAPTGIPSDPLEMTPQQLQTLAKLRKTEARDRFEQSQGFLSRTGERLKSMALPMTMGLTIGAGRGLKNRAAGEGIIEAMKGGAGRAAAVSGGVGLTGGVSKEVGLRRRQKQRKQYGMSPVGTPEENPQESFKEAMVQMSFGSGNQVPASVVLRGNKFKTAPGVQPRMMRFYRIQGTPYVAGVPAKVASKLEKAKDQKEIRKIIGPLMREEVQAQSSGRPVQGMFLLFHHGSNGKYRFLPPSPMRGM
jgi:hypothetical protein